MARRASIRWWGSVAACAVASALAGIVVGGDVGSVVSLVAAVGGVGLAVTAVLHERGPQRVRDDDLASGARQALGEAYRTILVSADAGRRRRWSGPDSPDTLGLLATDFAAAANRLLSHDARALADAVAFLESPEASELLAQLMRASVDDPLAERLARTQSYAPTSAQREVFAGLLVRLADRAMALALADEPSVSVVRTPAAVERRARPSKDGGVEAAFDDFSSRLRNEMLLRTRGLRLALSASQSRVGPGDLFVMPTVIDGSTHHEVGLNELAQSVHRALLIGPAGSGKTTLLRRITQTLADDIASSTPLLLAVRDLVPHMIRDEPPFTKVIEQTIEHTLGLAVPDGAVADLLGRGELTLLIDGIDEVEESYTAQLALQLGVILTRYPTTRVIVTARDARPSVAFGTSLNVLRLEPFSGEQMAEYARRRLAGAEATRDADITRSEALREQSKRFVDPLSSTPLLTALAFEIFLATGQLPANDLDLYEQGARLLLAGWDRSRYLYAPSSGEAALRPALEQAAFRVVSHRTLRGGLTKAVLVETIADSLRTTVSEDPVEARATAMELVEAFRTRSGLLIEIGLTATGEPTYQFLTSGFLEFFAASFLVRTNTNAHELNAALVPYVLRGDWGRVAVLTYQLWSRSHGRGDRLHRASEPVEDLLIWIDEASAPHRPALLDLAGAAFARITLPTVLAQDLSARFLTAAANDIADHSIDATHRSGTGALVAALSANEPNRTELANAAARFFDSRIHDPMLSTPTVQLIANLDTYSRGSKVQRAPAAYWSTAASQILGARPDATAASAATSFPVAYDLLTHGVVRLKGLLDAHDLARIFDERQLAGAESALPSVAERLLQWACSGSSEAWPSTPGALDALAILGQHLAPAELPAALPQLTLTRFPVLPDGGGAAEPREWLGSALWASLVLTCMYAEEAFATERVTQWLTRIGENRSAVAALTVLLLSSKLAAGQDDSWATNPLTETLPPSHRSFLLDWTRGHRTVCTCGEPQTRARL